MFCREVVLCQPMAPNAQAKTTGAAYLEGHPICGTLVQVHTGSL